MGRTSARAKELLRAAKRMNAEAAIAALPPTQEAVGLPIHQRVVVSGDGESTSASVFCRRRGRATDVATCAGCEHVAVVPKAQDSEVRCMEDRGVPHKRDASELAMRTRVAEVMQRNVACLRPGASVSSMANPRVADDAVVVVDQLLRPLGGQTLPETAPLSLAIGLLAQKDCTRAIVVGADGAVVGVVSASEIVGWLAQQLGYER